MIRDAALHNRLIEFDETGFLTAWAAGTISTVRKNVTREQILTSTPPSGRWRAPAPTSHLRQQAVSNSLGGPGYLLPGSPQATGSDSVQLSHLYPNVFSQFVKSGRT